MRRILVGMFAIFALVNTALAQPYAPYSTNPNDPQLPQQQAPDAKLPASSDTRPPITITMPDKTEVNGAPSSAELTPPPAVPAPLPISLEQPIDPDAYICGPGDVFELDFWGQQNFRLKVTIDLEGRAFISKVGYVTVSDKTLSAVRTLIKQKVRGNYPGLQFDLTLTTPRTFLVHVVNNVKLPGTYRAHAVERVSTVIARAGTIATGSKRRIAIHHRVGGDTTADLLLYELTGDTAYNPYLLDGDIINVPFHETMVSVAGAVRRPGTYEVVKTKDLAELLQIAGGFTAGVARSLPIHVVRRNDKQQDTFIDVPVGTSIALHDDDKVFVRGSEDVQRTVLLIGAIVGSDSLDSATTSRRLPYVEGDTVLSLIDRAGGIKAPGDLKRSYISRPVTNAPPQLIPIDLDALLVRRDFTVDKAIGIGDTIVIPPMQYSVMVEGAVARAGLYNYNPLFGVPEYIAHAGGLTRTARDMDDVKLIDPNGGTHDYRAGMTLGPGAAILVPERNFSRSEVAQLVLAGAGLLLSGVAIVIAARR